MREIASRFAQNPLILKAIAYGSRVRGDHRGDSDLDVLVIIDKKDKGTKDSIREMFYAHELAADLSFSVAIFSLEEVRLNERLGSPFLKAVMEQGAVFYDAESRGKEDSLGLSA